MEPMSKSGDGLRFSVRSDMDPWQKELDYLLSLIEAGIEDGRKIAQESLFYTKEQEKRMEISVCCSTADIMIARWNLFRALAEAGRFGEWVNCSSNGKSYLCRSHRELGVEIIRL